MVNFLIYLIISILASYGASILLVEKGNEWPIRRYRIILQKFIHDHIHYKASQVLSCSTCSSFWVTFFIDCILCVISGGSYFLWPLSGFITAGMTWTTIEYLNSQDKEQNINVFVDKED